MGHGPAHGRPDGRWRVNRATETQPCSRATMTAMTAIPATFRAYVAEKVGGRGRARRARVPRGGPAARRGRGPGRLVERQLQGRPGDARGRQGRADQPAHPRHRPGRRGRGQFRPVDRGRRSRPRPWLRAGRLAPRRLRRVPARAGRLGRAHAAGPVGARGDVDRDGRVHRGDVRGGTRGARSRPGRRAGPGHRCVGRRRRDGALDPGRSRLRGLGRDRQARRGARGCWRWVRPGSCPATR